nr:hypothetical protein LTR18_011120 [Exophiala xenobiotica]
MPSILNWTKSPPKEGRIHPGLPCSDERRRCRVISRNRIVAVIFILFITRVAAYLLESNHVSLPSIIPAGQVGFDRLLNRVAVVYAASDGTGFSAPPKKQQTAKTPETDRSQTTTRRHISTKTEPAAEASKAYPPNIITTKQNEAVLSALHNEKGTSEKKLVRNPDLEMALQRVVDLLPGEMNMRDLLRPVHGTGKEKLRELGLRTRSYRQFFNAWVDLHFAETENGLTYIRDDIVQYLTKISQIQASMGDGSHFFSSMSIGQGIRAYETYQYFLAKFGQLLFSYTSPFFADHMSLYLKFKTAGRGIVLTAGDDQAHFLMTTIHSFRELGCTLPVEVMYLGDSDLSEDYRAELETMGGVVTRDVSQMVNDEGWKLAGWAIKPFAMLFSSFREVIFIDADSLFFRNPEVLFYDPAYQMTGALFFKDRLMMPESKKRWVQQVLPRPFSSQVKQNRFWTGESAHMQEAGVVVVDKWKHFLAMLLVTRMNGPDRDGDEDKGKIGVYDMVYGDKETFWLGWELSGDFKYSFHHGDVGTMGVVDETYWAHRRGAEQSDESDNQRNDGLDNDARIDIDALSSEMSTINNYTICAPQLLHLDVEGKPLWFNGWVLDNKFADKSRRHLATFKSYVVEPHAWDGEEPWQLQGDNLCCLTAPARLRFDFSQDEKETLEMIVRRVEEVEALVSS